MDNEEFKRIAYPELAELVTERQGDIQSPQPLEISPWLAMSLLQKSIRRGETGHALRAAATLLRDAPEKLWKRLAVAVFEDIGLGSLDLIAPVMIATSGKGVRKAFGGEWPVVNAIVERMAAARKCRAADDVLMSVISHPRYEATRSNTAVPVLDQAAAVFRGNHTRAQIKLLLDEVMEMNGVPRTEHEYDRWTNVLVAMRQDSGATEMEILRCIRGIKATVPFPDSAGI